MPIEIRELVIEASLARAEDQGEDSTKMLTEEDREELKEEILQSLQNVDDLLPPAARQALLEELLHEVRKLLAEERRR
ncbi:DUF5908 family protein [Neolewinella lacunae]|uniref:Uncharacterized protein n=1 Tax=Neolewinella lacunae TaxID=1517758 RepID=A0A923TAN1_9BACT|nr:DUF5908 family protein [Neolewinella lacunae]MBC6996654.1 hypothetical protein [Neolewinella lacunae]MDN3634781.1 DUF5908 family protein [Neolewinella lacunae]